MKRFVCCIILVISLMASIPAMADSLMLPSGLKSIETEAFYANTSLDEVVIPKGVMYIGNRAFADSSVKTVHFPDSVHFIAEDAFSGVSSFKAYASENSYAAEWCKEKGVEVLPPESLTVSDDFMLPSGEIIEGNQGNIPLFSGTIKSETEIEKLILDLYLSDQCVSTEEVPVNSHEYDLSLLNSSWNMKLLPTGDYRLALSVIINGGKDVHPWKSSLFSVTAPSDVSENKAFDALFSRSSATVSASLRSVSMELSNAAYDEGAVVNRLRKDGFTNVDTHDYISGVDTCGVAIGWKNILDRNGAPKRLIAVICRGTNGTSEEWSSNFSMGSGAFHSGFFAAADRVNSWLYSHYLNGMFEEGLAVDDIIIWTTGHSRGAAVSNLLAGYFLAGQFSGAQVYCYTFAAPNVVRGGNISRSNIHNFIIGGDVVARVPLNAWGFGRYGQNYIYHNGETIGDIAVVDEGTMTVFCQALASESVMKKVETEMGKPGASFSLLYEILVRQAFRNVTAIPSAFETANYTWNTHTPTTYLFVAYGNVDDGYWSDEYLCINELPAPEDFSGKAVSPTAIQLTWSPSGENAYYEIRCDKAYTSGWSFSEITTDTSIIITGLEPLTNYAFDICSMRDGSKSKRSDTIHVKTNGLNLRCSAASATSITLEWDEAEGYASYEIRYGRKGTISWSGSTTVTGTGTTISGLKPDTAYAFDICAINGEMKTDRSSTVYASTAPLNTPSDFAGVSDAGSITLTWSPVSEASGYKIRYDVKGTWGWRYSAVSDGTSITITGLKSGKTYAFQILSCVDSYEGSWSDTMYAAIQ